MLNDVKEFLRNKKIDYTILISDLQVRFDRSYDYFYQLNQYFNNLNEFYRKSFDLKIPECPKNVVRI